MIEKLVGTLRGGSPIVEQMLMGGGKSTVIAPLLALTLADGSTLVMLTMPLALLRQQKAVMRATFSSIVRKRSFALTFDRSSQRIITASDDCMIRTFNTADKSLLGELRGHEDAVQAVSHRLSLLVAWEVRLYIE